MHQPKRGENMDLIDGIAWSKRFPTTFHLPSNDDIEALRPGDYVKLVFQAPPGLSERMWVEVIEVDGESYRGLLSNTPTNPFIRCNLDFGDELTFTRCNIIDVLMRPRH